MPRTGYDGAFSARTRSGWHRHHLIPRDAMRYPDLARFVVGLPLHLGDFAANGMFLPALENIARIERLPLHRGPHRRYSEIVLAALAEICRQASAQEALRPRTWLKVQRLQEQLRLLLTSAASEKDVALSSRDPFGPSANLKALDYRTEEMFENAMKNPVRRAE